MARHEAFFIPIRCVHAHKTFYARYDFAYDEKWVLTYGVVSMPTTQDSSPDLQKTNYDISNSRVGPQYKCPYCGNRSFVQCGNCNQLTCFSGEKFFLCDHCGYSDEVSGRIITLDGDKYYSQ